MRKYSEIERRAGCGADSNDPVWFRRPLSTSIAGEYSCNSNMTVIEVIF
jgi:hypothetical protein